MRLIEYAVIAAVLLTAAGYYTYTELLPVQSSVSFIVLGSEGNPVPALVQLYANNQLVAYGEAINGEITLEANHPRDAVLMARAEAEGCLPSRVGVKANKITITLQKQTVTEPEVGLLIVTDERAISDKYGADYADEAIESCGKLADAVEETEGLAARVELMGENYASVTEAVNALEPDYLLIVGGPQIIAFNEFQTPLKKASGALKFLADQDPLVPSDNAYGMLSTADYACNECHPDVAVGRIPDGNEEESDSTLLLELLGAAIAAHESGHPLDSMASVVSQDSYGSHLNRLVYAELNNEIVDSPPASVESGLWELFDAFAPARALFLSVHGSNPPDPQVYSSSDGFGEYYLMTRGIPSLEAENFTGKFVLADACYGANPYRSEGESLPLLFLRNGAVAFIGSTTSALANRKVSSQEFDDEAELLALGSSTAFHYRVLRGLRDGERIGDAVNNARREMLAGLPADELTAVQYVLYGDPTLRAKD